MAPDSSVSEFPHLLPCKLGAPSDFRQALPANGADGEAPVKVGGLRGARAARAKPRIYFGRRWGAKKKNSFDCGGLCGLMRWSMRFHAVSCGGLCGLNGGPCDGLCGLMRWSMRWSVCLSVLLSVCFCLCFCLCFVCASVCVFCLCWLCSALAARTVQKLFAFRVVWAPTHVRALDPLAYERGPECARACTHVGTAEARCDVGWHRASLWQPGWRQTLCWQSPFEAAL